MNSYVEALVLLYVKDMILITSQNRRGRNHISDE